MPREKTPPPDTSGQVPLWFLTYSDVITLLMTFFILLLTFATSEPESFEQMKVTFFGSQGAHGIAGPPNTPIEKDAVTMRYRPDASRVTERGSEQSPLHEDPHLTSMAKGLEGLDESPEHQLTTSYAIVVDLNMLIADGGDLTDLGRQRMSMLARHVTKGAHDLAMFVGKQDLDKAVTMAMYLSNELKVPPGQVSLGTREFPARNGSFVQIVLSHKRSTS